MTARVKRGAFKRSCRRCSWTGTYDTAAKGDYSKRRHSCERRQRIDERLERGRARTAKVDRTPKPCLHKVADHQHGTYACYTLDKCRCEPCSVAVSEYERNRKRQHAYGRWDNLVDAEPVREHIRALMAAGMGLKQVARAGNISHGVMWKLLYGKQPKPGQERRPSARVTKTVAERALAVEFELADHTTVDGAETSRRLQALVANGWSMSKLGARLGVTPGNFNPTVNARRRRVHVATAKAVHALYIELADVAPPEDHWRDKIAASRARGIAAQRGWAKPLRINGRIHVGSALPLPKDDTDYDIEAPSYDEAAVLRRLNGDRSVRLRSGEAAEVFRRARARGMSTFDIEHELGINANRYRDTDQEAS